MERIVELKGSGFSKGGYYLAGKQMAPVGWFAEVP